MRVNGLVWIVLRARLVKEEDIRVVVPAVRTPRRPVCRRIRHVDIARP